MGTTCGGGGEGLSRRLEAVTGPLWVWSLTKGLRGTPVDLVVDYRGGVGDEAGAMGSLETQRRVAFGVRFLCPLGGWGLYSLRRVSLLG